MSMGVLPVYKTHKRKAFFDLKLYCSKYICIYFEITVIKTWKLIGHTNSDFCLNRKFWIRRLSISLNSEFHHQNDWHQIFCDFSHVKFQWNVCIIKDYTKLWPWENIRSLKIDWRRCVHACTTLFIIDQTNKNLNTLSTQTYRRKIDNSAFLHNDGNTKRPWVFDSFSLDVRAVFVQVTYCFKDKSFLEGKIKLSVIPNVRARRNDKREVL